jgi:prepilin-type N-terminal cleavage/methylation domain-containing protein
MARGYSLLEVLLVLALITVLAGTAIPLALSSLDQSRAAAAATYVCGKLIEARWEAVKRSSSVGVQFLQKDDGYWFQTYVDGNGNGVLASDISLGIDRPLGPAEQLEQQFAGVTFGICPGVIAMMPGDPFNPGDPIQIGPTTVMSFSPNGSSTAGSLVIRGANLNQFAVVVSASTARSRIFHFDFAGGQWRN